MYCMHCGKKLGDNKDYCMHCGKYQKSNIQTNPTINTYNQKPKSANKMVFILIYVVFIISIILTIIIPPLGFLDSLGDALNPNTPRVSSLEKDKLYSFITHFLILTDYILAIIIIVMNVIRLVHRYKK